MATPIIMPRQGQSVESCIITKWHKKKGDLVEPGEVLFTYETDKATFEEEAQLSGMLLEIFFEEGDDVPVLTNVCVIGREGEDTSPYSPRETTDDDQPHGSDKSEAIEQTPLEDSSLGVDSPIRTEGENDTVKISPRARNLAEKAGVDFKDARPTGPEGRIIERDIIELIEKGPVLTPAAMGEYAANDLGSSIAGTGLGGRITTHDLEMAAKVGQEAIVSSGVQPTVGAISDYEEVKLTNIRKVIAKAMHQSLSTTAQLTLNSSFDATDILAFRSKLKNQGDRLGLDGITLNDIILFAVSRTLLNHRDLNAHFLDDSMRIYNTVNLGVAIDTPRGLMVPTVFNADRKSLYEISKEVKELAAACQAGTINPDLLTNGTFTVTNLGALGIESFTPVLNPPQTGILGVNNIVQRARDIGHDIEYYPAMGLSITFDHRAVDGAPAARFLKELTQNLENFSLLLAC